MGILLNRATNVARPLLGEQIVGRARDCALRVDKPYVSGHHAEIRRSGHQWLVKDLGSRNGTFVNGDRLAVGEWHKLQQGDVLSFGEASQERWELESDAHPLPMLVPLDGRAPIPIDGMLGMPPESPETTIWLDTTRGFWLELADQPAITLHHGSIFTAGGARYQLCCDHVPPTTELLRLHYEVSSTQLEIRHSLDEEYVEVFAEPDGEARLSLEARQHHVVLLALGRQRLEDRAQGVPEGSCGWVYIEDLLERLKVDRPQLNLHVYRVRQQFAALGFQGATDVVERRLQTKQVRLGFRNLKITRL